MINTILISLSYTWHRMSMSSMLSSTDKCLSSVQVTGLDSLQFFFPGKAGKGLQPVILTCYFHHVQEIMCRFWPYRGRADTPFLPLRMKAKPSRQINPFTFYTKVFWSWNKMHTLENYRKGMYPNGLKRNPKNLYHHWVIIAVKNKSRVEACPYQILCIIR